MSLPAYLGRYEVRHEIGRGGFAVVVQAWDDDLHSLVAIKILHPEFVHDGSDIQQRFLDEARLLRRIKSLNVVTIHDIGRLGDGRPYFVMDFADRGTLANRFSQTPISTSFDARSLAALVDALADGLSSIHEAGVVHRDIKPANILFQTIRRAAPDPDETTMGDAGEAIATLIAPHERILVGDLGIAKDLLRDSNAITMMAGTAFYRSPEQSEAGAEITPAADVYSATAIVWQMITRQRPPQANAVVDNLSVLPAGWREVLEFGMALDPKARFSSIQGWRAAIHDVLAKEVSETERDTPTTSRQSAKSCPYKGLAAYQPEDANRFYGREVLIDELVRRLQLQKVLIVGGPSGSGKSSLVRAGLIPAIKAGAIMGSDAWRIVLFTPGRDPMAELHFQLGRALPEGTRSSVSPEDLVARPSLARHLGQVEGADRPIIVCIDQFEELFTLAPMAQKTKVIEALSAMTDPAHSSVRLVIAVRADFYGACAQIPWLAERITDNQVLVGPMTDAELRRAITEPARRAGLHLERGLVDAVISEAGQEVGALPLVAHALVETWIRRKGSTMTLEGFRAAGGVAGAISQTADLTFEHRFDDVEKAASKRLFLRLVTPGEGTTDARRILARSEIEHDPGAKVLHNVVEGLTEARLLTVNDATVQIAHEALLRTWPRLRNWIEESRDNLRTRQRISRAAEEWLAEDRDQDRLYRGTPLLAALDWMEKNADQLGDLERSFIEASAEARDREKAAAKAKEHRARRIRRIATSALALLAAGATAASAIAFLAFRDAQSSKELADLATIEANERFAVALGAVANELVEEDPLLALYLAGEAAARSPDNAPGYDARSSLLAARYALSKSGPALLGSPVSAGDARVLALSADGTLLAVGRRDGSIDLIDATTRKPLGLSVRGHKGGIEDLDFDPRGETLASVGDDGLVQLWPIDGRMIGKAQVVARFHDVVWGVRFDPTGSMIATAAEDGTVRLWEAIADAPARPPLIHRTGDFLSMAFSPDGRGLVAGNGEGDIHGWTLPDGTPLFEPIRGIHTSDIWKLVFDPTGHVFATSSSDGKSILFAYPTGKVIGPAVTPDDEINGVAFSADGKILFGGGADGGLRLWDVAHDTLKAKTPSGHNAAIIDLELSGARNLIATLGTDQLIRFWRLESMVPLAIEYQVAGHAAKGLAFSPDGRWLAAGDDAGSVELWKLGAQQPPMMLSGHQQQVWALAFSPDGRRVLSGDRGGAVRIWNTETGALEGSIDRHASAIWSISVSPDGTRFATASESGVQLWDMKTHALQNQSFHDTTRITRAAWSPDGRHLAIASADARVRLWDVKADRMEREIIVDRDVVWSVAFSPDGRLLAAASGDETVTLWEVTTGAKFATLTGHSGGATDVAFLGDGASLVVVDRTGRLHFWDVLTGRQLIEPWQAHQDTSWRIAVHPDGVRFATAGDDGYVRVWDDLSVERACEISRDAFDETRRKEYFGDADAVLACAPPVASDH
ncbi:MAG TPA: protein kinase [Dongiaceae bacterium]|jgi:WD40 repeat protein/serine/threonine protein kinase|nr:protein kinase [Dongiaceae bacterium]